MNTTPYEIEFMLHCYSQGFNPYKRVDTPTICKFEKLGMIKPYKVMKNKKDVVRENCYTTTEKGAAWVKMLCNTPFPVQKWVDGRDGSVVE